MHGILHMRVCGTSILAQKIRLAGEGEPNLSEDDRSRVEIPVLAWDTHIDLRPFPAVTSPFDLSLHSCYGNHQLC